MNYVLERILPILMKRSADGVHNLDKPPSKTHQKKVNEFIEQLVALGMIESVNRSPLYLTKLFSPLVAAEPKTPSQKAKVSQVKEKTSPKQIYARMETIDKVLTNQQRHIAKHWTVEQMFDETFRSVKHVIFTFIWSSVFYMYM